MVQLTIHPAVSTAFPAAMVGAVEVRGVRAALAQIDLPYLQQQAMQAINALDVSSETLSQHSVIAAWRKAYQQMGVKPSKYRSSIEALIKRALKDGVTEVGIPAVDIYNTFSLIHTAPVGAYDLAKLGEHTTIALRHAVPETDQFNPLGTAAENLPFNPTLVTYAKDNETLCWAFNHRDSADYCLDDTTDHALFCSEAALPEHQAGMEAVLQNLAEVWQAAGAQVGNIQIVHATEERQVA